LRSLLVREMDQRRAEVSIFLQLARPEVVQDVPGERLLQRFPHNFRAEDDPNEKPEEKYDNLAQYDVIVAFDPNWTELTPEDLTRLERWVEDGGGLVVVGGPVHTFELARGVNYEKIKTILDLFPVALDDSRRILSDRVSTDPWRLNFPGASPE